VSPTLSYPGPRQAPVRPPRAWAAPAWATPVPGVATPVPSTRPNGRPRPNGRSRPHIVAFDMIRLIIMVFVVSVHTLAFGAGKVTLSVGAVTTLFHTSRELFLLLTALVLSYNYGKRKKLKPLKFWRRRFLLVLPAYVTWSAIYYAADGRSRGAFPAAFLHDLLNAGARYHLYFLLVSMQIYLLFPVLRWVLRKTEGYHRWLLGVALAYQVWLSLALHYHLGRPKSGALAQFLNGAGQGYYVDTYVLYVVAGAVAGWHFEQLCAFTRRHLGTGPRIAAVTLLGAAAGLVVFLTEIYAFGATPNSASAVFQPVVIFEAFTFGWALLGAGLLWSDRGAPARKFCAAGSASSFGIYLAHPLILQTLLIVAASSHFGAKGGLVGDLHRMRHSSIEVLILLFVVVPLIYATAWIAASAARRTSFSLPLTGRETRRGKRRRRRAAGNSPIVLAFRTFKTKRVLHGYMTISAVAVIVLGGTAYACDQMVNTIGRPTTTQNYSMNVDGMTRNWQTIAPTAELPKSAPIIIVISGIYSTISKEETRDRLTPYVSEDQAELVYPQGFKYTWNAIGCCSWAARYKVNDVAFIEDLVTHADPGHQHPVYIVGYSDGGRLAYRIACTDPGLVDGMAIVKADPMPGCVVSKPMNILVISSLDDHYVPFKTGEKGRESPSATVQVARLQGAGKCSATTATSKAYGTMTYKTWSCADGDTLAWAVWQKSAHSFPGPTGIGPTLTPGGGQTIWSFVTKTPIAPTPK
jgi:poly(3-hydroxybutyrate) depolymerase/peptidoglycan/LPS O-acetylase OafA/YrhL